MGQLLVRRLRSEEEVRWDELMATHHYLGFRKLVGESLKYVAEEGGRWLALLGWATAAFKCGPRDRWIGWAPEQQWSRLRYVVNNARFLVLPEARRPNLASQVLAANLRRLWADWQCVFGHPALLAETFVDARFLGTCYRAAGWQVLGRTQGYGRSGGRYYFHGARRTIWVKPLHRKAREWLAAPFEAPVIRTEGRLKVDLNCIMDVKGEFLKLLGRVPDGRKRRGIRHHQASVLAIAAGAVLSNCRNYVAIGEWTQELPQSALKRLGCRYHPGQRRYIAPCESTIRRAVQRVDAEVADQVLGGWLQGKLEGKAIAVDGKTLNGSVDSEGRKVHLLGALVQKEGVVIAQRPVDEKTNEITAFKPLLEPINLEGKVVTADAMHTQRDHAQFLVEEKKADYLFVVKDNQPTLKEDLQAADASLFSPSAHYGGEGSRAD